MTRLTIAACTALCAAPLVFTSHNAHACSCVAPQPEILSPAPGTKIPLNGHVRVVLPTYLKGKLVLREHRGAEVSTSRVDSPLQNIAHVDLIPQSSLHADTRYEVALIRPEKHPSTLVFGTFVTGSSIDSLAPAAPKIARTVVNGPRGSAMTSCAVFTPWAEVFLSPPKETDRDNSSSLHAIWASDGQKPVDLNGPPTAFVIAENGKLKLGRTSSCDPEEFPLPTQGTVKLAIVAIDDAGNRSAVQRVSLTMSTPVEARQ